jgi:thymidylate kinase
MSNRPDIFSLTKYPIFVVEGPDGAGKTSLCEALKQVASYRYSTNVGYIHLTYRWKDRMHLYHTAALHYAARLSRHQPVIVDRWWPSEIVYADAYRGGSKFVKHYFRLEHAATLMGLTYVLCLPADRERYLAHFDELKNKRDEMYLEGMQRVYDGYAELYRDYLSLRNNVITYDMFDWYAEDDDSREMALISASEKVLEITEEHRSLYYE